MHFEDADTAVTMAAAINDAFAREVEAPQAFHVAGDAAVERSSRVGRELERAMKELGLPGAMVFSNVNGTALADAVYEPLWTKANELNAVIYIHPAHPADVRGWRSTGWWRSSGFCSTRRSPLRTWCSRACSNATPTSHGRSPTWAARYRTWPSARPRLRGVCGLPAAISRSRRAST